MNDQSGDESVEPEVQALEPKASESKEVNPAKGQTRQRTFWDRILSLFGLGYKRLKKDIKAETEATRAMTDLMSARRSLRVEVDQLDNVNEEIEKERSKMKREKIEEQEKLDEARRRTDNKELKDKIEKEKLKAELAEQRRRRKRAEGKDPETQEKSDVDKLSELQERWEEKKQELRENGYSEEDEVWKRMRNKHQREMRELME